MTCVVVVNVVCVTHAGVLEPLAEGQTVARTAAEPVDVVSGAVIYAG